MVWSECTECVKSPDAVSECRLFTAKQYLSIAVTDADNTGQQNLTFFLAHEEKYLIPIELLTLNSNV